MSLASQSFWIMRRADVVTCPGVGAQELRCVKMCQCSSMLSYVNEACVFSWSQEAGWQEVGSLSFKGRRGEYEATLSAEKFNCSLHESLVAPSPPGPPQDGDASSSNGFAGRTLAIIVVCSTVGAACLTMLTLYIKKRRFFTPQDLHMFTASAAPSGTSEGDCGDGTPSRNSAARQL
ncbi:hypothetical protein CYMTET_25822 [Cymbomonas tetramitiformis]|uniref:Uncharacterized protein n=1 Tax=Cymbomonas tetramitiformis TaxID=36881 RepID=A0AAE0FTF4_9CHLO|nr:hypothetical protein CYMTET_25822 [Cymbomonas tetramitiformis]